MPRAAAGGRTPCLWLPGRGPAVCGCNGGACGRRDLPPRIWPSSPPRPSHAAGGRAHGAGWAAACLPACVGRDGWGRGARGRQVHPDAYGRVAIANAAIEMVKYAPLGAAPMSPRGTATMPAAARAERLRGWGGGSGGADARRQALPHAAGAALLALAVAAVAALAPTMLLDGASAIVEDASVGTFNGNATQQYTTNGNDSSTITNYTFYFPRDLAVDVSGRLILADTGPNKNTTQPPGGQRVVVLNDDYSFNNSIGIYGNRTADGGQFDGPIGVATNSTGHIFVVEQNYNRTQIFNPDGTYLHEFNRTTAELPDTSSTPDNRPLFANTFDVAVSPDDKLIYLTADGGTVYMVDASTYRYVDKVGGLAVRSAGGDLGRFDNTYGMDFGAGGLLAVSDDRGLVVSVLDPADNHRRLFEVGEYNNSGMKDEGLFGDPNMDHDKRSGPTSVSFSNDGNLLAVADGTNYRVQVFQLNKSSDGRVNNVASPMPAFVVNYPSGFSPLAVEFSSNDSLVVGRIGLPTSILDVYELILPAVKNVTATANVETGNFLTIGSSINITVGFNTNVRVDTMGGMPFLELGTSGRATYMGGNGADTLRFSYTIRDHDKAADLEYDPATVLNLNGSTITAGQRSVTALTDFSRLNGTSSLLVDHGLGEIDADGPAVLNAYSTNASTTYTAGSSIEVVLNYSEPVLLSGPEPTLKLNIDATDGADVFASYRSGNTTNKLVFNYTVQPGHITPEGGLRYAGADALIRDGTTMMDEVGNPANYTLPTPEPPIGINVDARPPSVSAVASVSDPGVYRPNDAVEIAVDFNEAVTVTGSPVLGLATDPARNATYVNVTDNRLLFRYMVQEGDSAPDGLRYAGTDALSADGDSIMDAAGNTATNLTLPTPVPLAGIVVNGTRVDSGSINGSGNGSGSGTPDGTGQNATTTCSLMLAKPMLNLEVAPGKRSMDVNQTLINNGTAPFRTVVLEASEWYIDYTDEGRPNEGHPSLPASLTEMRLEAGAGAEALTPNGTAVDVPEETGRKVVWFQINLTGETEAPGETLTQYIDYTAECSMPQ